MITTYRCPPKHTFAKSMRHNIQTTRHIRRSSPIEQLNTLATTLHPLATAITTFVFIYSTMNWTTYRKVRIDAEKQNDTTKK